VFELQIMPQALHYVLSAPGGGGGGGGSASASAQPQEAAGSAGWGGDFGTIAVYTCPRSCPLADVEGGPYAEEVAWVQPAGDKPQPPPMASVD
jgi:hypothetical protein